MLVGQVFFRSNSLHDVWTVLADMIGRLGLGQAWPRGQVILIAALLAFVWLMPNTQEIVGESQENDTPNWSIFPLARWSAAAMVGCDQFHICGEHVLFDGEHDVPLLPVLGCYCAPQSLVPIAVRLILELF